MNIEAAYYVTALTLGILGSFHCVGMCGPLAIMLPTTSGSNLQIIIGRSIYNFGRIVTYAVLGGIAGLAGASISFRGFQRELSMGIGIFLLITLFLSIGYKLKLSNRSLNFSIPLRNTLKKLFSRRTKTSLFLIGVLNGLLPCGLVYIAIAGSFSAGSVSGSFLYMFLFGLGTFPMMMAVSLFTNYIGPGFKLKLSKLSMYMTFILALLLIFRGININTQHCSQNNNTHTPINCRP